MPILLMKKLRSKPVYAWKATGRKPFVFQKKTRQDFYSLFSPEVPKSIRRNLRKNYLQGYHKGVGRHALPASILIKLINKVFKKLANNEMPFMESISKEMANEKNPLSASAVKRIFELSGVFRSKQWAVRGLNKTDFFSLFKERNKKELKVPKELISKVFGYYNKHKYFFASHAPEVCMDAALFLFEAKQEFDQKGVMVTFREMAKRIPAGKRTSDGKEKTVSVRWLLDFDDYLGIFSSEYRRETQKLGVVNKKQQKNNANKAVMYTRKVPFSEKDFMRAVNWFPEPDAVSPAGVQRQQSTPFDRARTRMAKRERQKMDMAAIEGTREMHMMKSAARMVPEAIVRTRQELALLRKELQSTKSSVKRFNLEMQRAELGRRLSMLSKMKRMLCRNPL